MREDLCREAIRLGRILAELMPDEPGAMGLLAHHLFHAIRANLLRRLGRTDEATAAYEAAIARTGNEAERSFLRRQGGLEE